MTTPTAAEELRELIRDAHAAAKDIRAAVKDAREVTDKLAPQLVEDRLTKAIEEGLEQYVETVKTAMDQAVEKVDREFQKLADLYIKGPGKGQPDLHELAMRQGRRG